MLHSAEESLCAVTKHSSMMKLMSRSAAVLDVLIFDLMQEEEENEGEDDNISGHDSESDGEQADKRKVLTSRGNFAPPVFAHLLQHLCYLVCF